MVVSLCEQWSLRSTTGRLSSHGGVAMVVDCATGFFVKPTAWRSDDTRMPSGGIWLGLFWKNGRLPFSDLDFGSGHTAYRRASVINLYLRTEFHWDRKKHFFESHHWGFGQVQSHVTQKLGQISKIRPDQI